MKRYQNLMREKQSAKKSMRQMTSLERDETLDRK